MGKPESYRLAPTCGTCKWVTTTWEYDSETEYWCTLGAPLRPPCGSVGMDERFTRKWGRLSDEEEQAYQQANKAWDDWSAGRGVKRNGVCDEWVIGERV